MYRDRPNVIVMVVDAMRADHLSCYGYSRPTSPNLDRFAEQAVQFRAAFSASPSTVGSIPSILTGVYPSFHGTGVDGNTFSFHNGIPSLAEVLQQEGYVTVGFNTNPYMMSQHGYDRGYTSYFDLFSSNTKTSAQQANEQIAAWLTTNPDRPFFMWVHYLDTHGPYYPREPYYSFVVGGSLQYGDYSTLTPESLYAKLCKEPCVDDPDLRRRAIDCYDSEVRYFDANFGLLLDMLRQHHVLDSTAIFLSSDHGEAFWEHGRWGHPMEMYDVNIHVPLLVRYPEVTATHMLVSEQVRNIDIYPTILDILGVEPKHQLCGMSLLPYLTGAGGVPELPLLSEGGGLQGVSVSFFIDRVRALRTGEWKYIKNETQNTKDLYRLSTDRFEQNNLFRQPGAQQMVDLLESELARLLPMRGNPEVEIAPAEADSIVVGRLKDLGYL